MIDGVPDPEDILAEYLNEHSYWSDFDSDHLMLSIQFGVPELVPELPTMGDTVCVFCNTRVSNRDGVGWVHEDGFASRGGCAEVWPK